MKTQLITSRRELAIKLYNGKVSVLLLSKRVQRTVDMWLSRNEVIIENGFLKLK